MSEYQNSIVECSYDQNLKKEATYQKEINNNNDVSYLPSSCDSLYVEGFNNNNIPPKDISIREEETLRIFRDARKEIKHIPEEQHRKWLINRFTEYYGSVVPRSILEFAVSHFFHGDSGASIDVIPDWLDMEKFQRGQKLAMDNLFGIFYADTLSLLTVFSLKGGLEPLIFTDASSTPYTAFKRYVSTGSRVINWYSSDPWTPGTPAYNEICTVRRMHAMVRNKILNTPNNEYEEKTRIKEAWCPAFNCTRRDFESACPVPKASQCAYAAASNFPELREHRLSQGEMAATQFAFSGLVILRPKFFGLHDATDDNIEAFCHMWRGLGYLLGIDDESNFCRGTLEDVRTRSKDFLEYWVKPNFRVMKPEMEHMMRCVLEGLQYCFPRSTYESCLLDLAEIMNLNMPCTYNSLSYSVWIRHNLVRFYFNQGIKLSGLRELMNRRLKAALQKARNFDEQKHQELKDRSTKTLHSYSEQRKANEHSVQIRSKLFVIANYLIVIYIIWSMLQYIGPREKRNYRQYIAHMFSKYWRYIGDSCWKPIKVNV